MRTQQACGDSGRLCATIAANRQQEGAAPDSSGQRPAVRLHGSSTQIVPKTIVQTGQSWASALARHAWSMQTWWRLNPEYTYAFFSDAQAAEFTARHGTAEEQEAWKAMLVGAARADLFRLLYLKYAGGTYADLDEELARPLRELIAPNDTGVVGTQWPFEFLVYTPHHPVIVEAARLVVGKVLEQAQMHRAGSPRRCTNHNTCVVELTGPNSYWEAVLLAARAAGCAQTKGFIAPSACRNSANEPMRRLYVCRGDVQHGKSRVPPWVCETARHWDCRLSPARCNDDRYHYSHLPRGGNNFFV